MNWKLFFSVIFILFAVGLLIIYWFVPFNSIDFGSNPGHYNFNIENNTDVTGMQFYKNMRFPSTEITYFIEDSCTLQKRNNMEWAFEIMSDDTNLGFYSLDSSGEEQISVTCDSKTKIQGGLFIAGEGGPTNITQAGDYNIISQGQILLLKESQCQRPNVAIHELLHVLGFDHSLNSNNIMYEISKCKQVIGDDTINRINELYSLPTQPDLVFENVSAYKHGIYLDTNISVRNNGFKDSEQASILIYADDKLVDAVDLDPLGVGFGKMIKLTNHRISKLSVNEIRFVLNTEFEELSKDNNELTLSI
ncbi:matrixin family metalloprotease [Nanoarchaeota archaeon]